MQKTPPRSQLRPNQFVYIRAKVTQTNASNGQEACIVVQFVDKFGRPSEDVERFVREDQVITVADAIKAVGEATKR